MTTQFTLTGTVLEQSTHSGVENLRVEAWDVAGIFKGLVGLAHTDVDGAFSMHFRSDEVTAIFGDRAAEVYFRVIDIATSAELIAHDRTAIPVHVIVGVRVGARSSVRRDGPAKL